MSAKTDRATAYARAVKSGRIVTGKPVRLACERHLRDLKRKDLVWKLDQAERAIEFFADMLVFEDGKPFLLEPFQCFIVGSIFGWYTKAGDRRFRTAYCEIGKGNGKSPLAAGIGIYGLVADGEPAPEVYAAAVTHEQARIVFKDATRMVEESPELKELIHPQVGSLTIPSEYATFRPVSSEHRSLDGLRVHMGLIDELHEHPSALVVDKIRAGTKSRRNALIFEITNSGYDRHSVCWNHHEYSLKVLEDVIPNDSWFAYVCSLDDGDDWRDERCWVKVNPGLGSIIQTKYLSELVEVAKGMPTQENLVRRLNFCEWTEQSVRAIPMEEWARGAAPIDAEALRGRSCFAGLDLARVNDLSALELLFPPVADGELWKVLSFFWCPEDDIGSRSLRDRVPYDVWARQGFLIATPGNTTDYGFIEAKVLELAGQYQIKGIGFDRTFAGEIVQSLMAENLNMVEVGQGFLSLAAPTAELLRMVKAGELQHGNHPILNWMASNLACATDAAGNLKPDKEHSAEKIDGISALDNALYLAGKAPVVGPNPWDERVARGEDPLPVL